MKTRGGLYAVHARHRNVQHNHIGIEFTNRLKRAASVVRLAHHVDVRLFFQHRAQRFAQHAMIVGKQDPDFHAERLPTVPRYPASGIVRLTIVPSPGRESISMVPPMKPTRSRTLTSPNALCDDP